MSTVKVGVDGQMHRDGDRKRWYSFTNCGTCRTRSRQELLHTFIGSHLGNDARERIRIMSTVSNGFEIAEKDLNARTRH